VIARYRDIQLFYGTVVWLWILLCFAAIAGCDHAPSAPPPPATTPSQGEQLNGTERLAWDQRAADAVELAAFRYAIYIDGARSELVTSCASASTNGAFSCSARVPAMTRGSHTLELATFIVDGTSVFESSRSAPFLVTVTASTSSASQAQTTTFSAGPVRIDGDQTPLLVEVVAEGLHAPGDLTFAPDGRLFISEASGRIRIVRDQRLIAAPALSLGAKAGAQDEILALAFDPQFDRTRFVYVLYTTQSRAGEPSYAVARFRESSDTLADEVLLLDQIPAPASNPAASLRFGPDRKLYVAFDDGGNARLAGDLSSPNGKVSRLNSDGSTPDDQAGGSPLFSSAYRSPRGLDWDPASGVLWVLDAAPAAPGRLSAVVATGTRGKRGVTTATVPLPDAPQPSSMTFYRGGVIPALEGTLLIASTKSAYLLRVRFDPDNRTHIVGADKLLRDQVGAIRAVTIGPDGAVYFAAGNAIGRLMSAATLSRK
jgi:glucose/arabinose dehydrogenase